uniref:Uncharacterized protein n=1 Tax=Seriola lalandi dorsalis TaxID=1841481 RepID=A0A3B4XX10_SERLL
MMSTFSCYHLRHNNQLLLHGVTDQVWSRSSRPAVQIIGGDGIRSLGGVQLGVGQQLLDSLSQKTRSLGLCLQSGCLGVLVQSFGLSLDAPGFVAVGTGLLEDGVVVGEPLGWCVLSGAVPRGG